VRLRHRGGTRRVLAATALSLGALWLSGCTSARNTLGTNSSPCFRALAPAEDAVNDRGVFSGVRLMSAASLKKLHHFDSVLTARSKTPLHNLCLVAYRGTYRPDQVKRPAGRVPPSGVGHFAVVVVSSPQNVLLGTFVFEREPVRFRHLALGSVGDVAPPKGGSLLG